MIKEDLSVLPTNKMNRINELARKSKISELTKEEQLEQQELRREYIETFRASFRQQLDNIEFVDDKDGNNTPPSPRKSH